MSLPSTARLVQWVPDRFWLVTATEHGFLPISEVYVPKWSMLAKPVEWNVPPMQQGIEITDLGYDPEACEYTGKYGEKKVSFRAIPPK